MVAELLKYPDYTHSVHPPPVVEALTVRLLVFRHTTLSEAELHLCLLSRFLLDPVFAPRLENQLWTPFHLHMQCMQPGCRSGWPET
jgi:hypothetical protein